MDLGLKDKVAIVTGGASGIGEAIVRQLVADEAKVLMLDRDATRCQEITNDLQGQGETHFTVVDLCDFEMCRVAVENAIAGRPFFLLHFVF